MSTIGRPTGLIRYSTQDLLAGKPVRLVRPRTIIYPAIILIAVGLFIAILSTKFSFDSRLMGAPGAPFSLGEDQRVQNNFQLRLVNRSQLEQVYSIQFENESIQGNWSSGDSIRLAPGRSLLVPIDVHFPVQVTLGQGYRDATLTVSDSSGSSRAIPVRLSGPR